MFTKTMIALCASVVLAVASAPAATAQTPQANAQEWWRTVPQNAEPGYIARRNCVRGEESASSAYPSWMHC